jgi:hypothetical protein
MMTLEFPFDKSSYNNLLLEIMNKKIEVNSIKGNYDPSLKNIICQMLEKV